MFKRKHILLFVLFIFSITNLGCGGKSDKNDDLSIVFCPGIAYTSGANQKFIYSSINREYAEGSIRLGDKTKVGSNILPSMSSNYRYADNRYYLKDQTITREKFTLEPVINGEAQTPITKAFNWNIEPSFSGTPSATIIDTGGSFKNLQITFGKLKNAPENTSVKYRIKIYQFEEGGNLKEMSAQQSSSGSIETSFRKKMNDSTDNYPVLEAMIYQDNVPIMVVHYVLAPF